MISFAKLLDKMNEKGITKTDLKRSGVIVGGTYTNVMSATKKPIEDGLTLGTINKLCKALDCQPGDIMEYVSEDPII